MVEIHGPLQALSNTSIIHAPFFTLQLHTYASLVTYQFIGGETTSLQSSHSQSLLKGNQSYRVECVEGGYLLLPTTPLLHIRFSAHVLSQNPVLPIAYLPYHDLLYLCLFSSVSFTKL